jgi:hypothetical protein
VEERVDERERKREVLPVGKQKKRRRRQDKKQRRRGIGIPQGLMRNFRKLQGPFCKTKFPINLKPK